MPIIRRFNLWGVITDSNALEMLKRNMDCIDDIANLEIVRVDCKGETLPMFVNVPKTARDESVVVTVRSRPRGSEGGSLELVVWGFTRDKGMVRSLSLEPALGQSTGVVDLPTPTTWTPLTAPRVRPESEFAPLSSSCGQSSASTRKLDDDDDFVASDEPSFGFTNEARVMREKAMYRCPVQIAPDPLYVRFAEVVVEHRSVFDRRYLHKRCRQRILAFTLVRRMARREKKLLQDEERSGMAVRYSARERAHAVKRIHDSAPPSVQINIPFYERISMIIVAMSAARYARAEGITEFVDLLLDCEASLVQANIEAIGVGNNNMAVGFVAAGVPSLEQDNIMIEGHEYIAEMLVTKHREHIGQWFNSAYAQMGRPSQGKRSRTNDDDDKEDKDMVYMERLLDDLAQLWDEFVTEFFSVQVADVESSDSEKDSSDNDSDSE